MKKYIQDNLDYYNNNYKIYEKDKHEIKEFTLICQPFLEKLPKNSLILDFGCGTGRDIVYFLRNGYRVEGLDGSEKMCAIANKNTGLEIKCINFLEFAEENKYDGIWACASLVHLTKEDLIETLKKLAKALKKDGYIYTTFKVGTFEGIRNGRYFIDMDENKFKEILKHINVLKLEKVYYNTSTLKNQHNKSWINFILKK